MISPNKNNKQSHYIEEWKKLYHKFICVRAFTLNNANSIKKSITLTN